MRYKIKDIGEDGVDVRVAVTEAWLKAECSELEIRPSEGGIALSGRLERAGDAFLLRGVLRGGIVVTCSRCLEPASLTLDVPVTVTYEEGGEPTEQGEQEEQEQDVIFFQDDVIDLGSEIRDELLLALPMGPLCREDCAGICPTCGANRNLTPCDCPGRSGGGGKFGALAKVKL